MQSKQQTAVLSFRVPADFVKQVDRQARKAKKNRSQFIDELFRKALESHVALKQSFADLRRNAEAKGQ